MHKMTDFYDALDLKYPEIGIAMDRIDRTNPGKIRFIIPVLTPNMDTSSIVKNTVYQDSNNLKNKNSILEIDNIEMKNYVSITIPRELCAYLRGVFDIEEWDPKHEVQSKTNIREAKEVLLQEAQQSGSGPVAPGDPGIIDVFGEVTAVKMGYKDAITTGRINLLPVDRYIEPGSKWIIVFVGGDITKPRVIARYPDD